ncbi:uncharacterized protein F4812DRAFT_462090 [Daldinia caldariorum]|uniref:uncharacterized protein n=1 Tax=Daldinia caldariorum TaxID=326644 RepID=UPI002007C00C|nr:uncharacterized protein F4812DRAFT_462090 [Daldinia caldariorum]KAI1465245.1 hypothetical protein F4812DRAFT_462090 [Daldinia caldariorum]
MIPTRICRLTTLAFTTTSFALSNAASSDGFGPSLDSARENGPQIFNALHNAMREFGSAIHHNGMSVFPGVIPEGVILYHGTGTTEVPKGFEWLAFEIEHAEAFSRCQIKLPDDGDRNPGSDSSQFVMRHPPPPDKPWKPVCIPYPDGGHLHIYQAARPLNVLYIDGMAAGKTQMGTIDTQDILLATNRSRSVLDDWGRADGLCALARKWKIDGFIRMEPGFEIIYCDFTNGLRLLSANRRPKPDDPSEQDDVQLMVFEWARAAAQRYQGIGSSRVILDYSSMVSGFFYPINLTNPNPERPDLPRLVQASDAEIDVVREHVGDAVARSVSSRKYPVGWQGVTDMIVARYSKRLPFLAQTNSIEIIRNDINGLLNIFIDYAEPDDGFLAARKRCANFYLQSAHGRTLEDELIYAAVEQTTAMICTALFKVRELVVEDPDADKRLAVEKARQIIRDLIETLAWPEWKECGRCQPDELCFVAMWPFGNVEDHYNPSCVNFSSILGRSNYWKDLPPQPPQLWATEQQSEKDDGLGIEEL